MFEKSLSDLIRGIRANKRSEQTYITTCLDEIRAELKAKDSHVKYLAVAKLCYLHMLGYDGAWAAFPILEVMAAPKFAYKRCGYLAASLSFRQDTEILMLCTNLLRKDLTSHHVPEIGVALDGLAHIATPELARDLSQDTLQLLHHPQVYVVKRAVLTLYKLFLKYPEALRASFPVLKERLEHPDPAVVSAVVNVICELARQNPRNYLPLAPHFYRLLNDSGNNWMLIKIVKLFASLTPLEPRLARKLVAPLTALVQKTPAMSVLYECIHTAIVGGIIDVPTPAALRAPNEPDDPDAPPQLAVLCAAKLRLFLKDNDHNLKYIGLLAMTELQARYPELVLEHRTLILRCLDDADLNIRLRALDLVAGVVDQENLIDVVRRLLGQLTAGSGHHLASQDVTDGAKSHRLDGSAGLTAEAHVTVAGVLTSGPSAYIESPEYRRAVVDRILTMCSARLFAHVADFEWYLAVLVDLVYVAGVNAGSALTAQFMAVAVRVSSVRPLAVKMMTRLLADRTLLESAAQPASNAGVLYAAAWIAGEYCDHHTSPLTLLQYLLDPAVARLPDPAVQAVYLQSIAKVLVSVVRAAHTRLTAGASCPDLTQPRWQPLFETLATTDAATQAGFAGSPYPEVRARAHDVRAMVAFFRNLRNGAWATTHLNDTTPSAEALNQVNGLLHGAFAARALNPVAARAQAKVPLPANLDLDVWFNPVVGRELEGLRGLDGAVAALRIFPVPSQSEARDGHRQRHHRGPTSSRRTRETEVPLPPLCTPEGFPILVPEEPKPTPRASDTRSRPRSKYLGSHRSKNPFYISEAKSGRADFYSLDEGSASDVDQIPIVQLDLNDISPSIRSMSASNAEKRPRRHRQSSRAHHNHDGVDHRSGKPSADGEDEDKKARRHRRPAPAPAIMIPEEMPDGVEASDSETGPHQSTGRTAATRDALTLSELDTQRLTTLDLTVPGATNVALPKSQAYAHPETTRRVEQAKFWKQARQTTSV
ncbi:AP-3 complex subunit delta, partial [Tieghemiomyces parasiticus]